MKVLVRYIISIIGSSIVGIGVGLCVPTGLGADALGVLWEGLAKHLPVTVGQASLIVTMSCFLIVLTINRHELGLATFLNPIATSITTDIVIMHFGVQKNIIFQMFIVVLGISFIGIGSGIAAATNTGKESYIALSFALSKKLHIDLAKVRMLLDALCFILGSLLTAQLMIGPVVGVLLIGPLLKITSQYCGKKIQFLLQE